MEAAVNLSGLPVPCGEVVGHAAAEYVVDAVQTEDCAHDVGVCPPVKDCLLVSLSGRRFISEKFVFSSFTGTHPPWHKYIRRHGIMPLLSNGSCL